jgi:hemolysin III
MTVVALYSVSALYHHTVYRDWLGKLDHIMIFYVISITALPYWGYIIPFPWYPGGLLAIIVICVVGTVVKTVSFLPRFVSGAAYLAAAVPMVSYFIVHYSHIPTPYGALWMIGLFFHGGLLVVYTLKTPDPFPALFGFREVQHVLLVCATNLHSYVAITVAHNISHSP